MYESFFQLQARPFLASPSADRYYPAASIEHTRETVARCIERAEGPAVILGSAGTGKSMLCQVLAKQFQDRFLVATLASARLCTRRALLQNILFELKQPYRDREEGELRLSLIDFLQSNETCPNGMLLLVDEAQVLPLRLLEEIRMLTNLVHDGQPRVRLVLAAGLILDERLASPRLESFNQRIAARCYLQSMNRDETCGYVRAQISYVGGDPNRVFTEDGLHAVYRATDGIPRLVNQVCDHVLVMAAVGQTAPVDATGVEEAWADLQQLPTPWTARDATPTNNGDSDGDKDAGILEFGELDEPVPCASADDQPVADVDAAEMTSETLAPQVDARFDAIESGISAMVDDDTSGESVHEVEQEEQFRPQSDKDPEIELVFHQAHNPFNEPFEEEEVIVDPFSSLESLSGSMEAARMHENNPLPTIPFNVSDNISDQQPEGQQDRDVDDDAPSYHESELFPAAAEIMSDATDTQDAIPGDDRDLIEIHDDSAELQERQTVMITEKPPRRRAYRQLFAELRRK